ncbi:MAG: DnaJ domain-containing protein [Proteobacteria bacterium]|nr:DnaJ domain-containing protein [Pseudomonadota bacterium]
MLYLVIGAVILWLLVGLGRGQVVFKRREWRLASSGFALAAFAGAAYAGLRGGWEISIVLVVLGLWLVTTSRMNRPRVVQAPPPPREMTASEARSILGVGPEATDREIDAAYKRLMRSVHPDKGGTSGLAAQLNAARAKLLED